jgi:acetyl esterase/lipase
MSLLTSFLQNDTFILAGKKNLPAQTIIDVPYGKDPKQTMDVYLPEGRTADSTPSLILVHGGGWNNGNKSGFNSYIDSFRKRMPGYAFFNINYRLFNGGNKFPTQEQDLKAAVDFIVEKANEYQVNKNMFALLGASAGAHMALLQAYKYKEPAIRAVIDFFGPTDLTEMYQNPWHPYVTMALEMITGATPSSNPALYYGSSPANFIDATSAPTLILHGANDQVVDISQSRLLQKKLEKAGVKNELVVYPSQRHGWHGSTLSNSFDRIEKFLGANVK